MSEGDAQPPPVAPTLAYQTPGRVGEEVEGHWATPKERFQAGLVDWVSVWIGGFAFGLIAGTALGRLTQKPASLFIVPTWLLIHVGLDVVSGWTLGRSGMDLIICTEARGIPSKLQVAVRAVLQRPWIWCVLPAFCMGFAREALGMRVPRGLYNAVPFFLGACGVWWLVNAVLCAAGDVTLVDRISRTRLARIEGPDPEST